MVCGLLEAQRSGRGQVIDSAMTDGSASLMTMVYGMFAAGAWEDERGRNAVDGGSHFYTVYETRDGKHVSVGSIEDKFYAELLERTGVDPASLPAQFDREEWANATERFAAIFRTKTRDEWCEIMEGSDVCFAPVLSLGEAPAHPHNRARETFVEVDGVVQPAPAPRFSRTVPRHPAAARAARRAHRRGPRRLGLLGRGDRGPPRRGGDRGRGPVRGGYRGTGGGLNAAFTSFPDSVQSSDPDEGHAGSTAFLEGTTSRERGLPARAGRPRLCTGKMPALPGDCASRSTGAPDSSFGVFGTCFSLGPNSGC